MAASPMMGGAMGGGAPGSTGMPFKKGGPVKGKKKAKK